MISPLSILLIEDNALDTRLVREMLVDASPHSAVTHVTRLAEALDRLGDAPFDAILLDLTLPDACGLETVTTLHRAAPAVPIVVMSGNDDETLAYEGVRAGVQDYLLKGRVDGDGLVRALHYAVERKRGAEALRASEARLALQYATARLLAEADSLRSVMPDLLRTTCESLGWTLAEWWRMDREEGRLCQHAAWHTPSPELESFVRLSEQVAFAPGSGIPGRVWASGAPDWVSDLAADGTVSRALIAATAGLHGAVGIPVLTSGNAVHSVIILYSRAVQPHNADLLQALAAVGVQIGGFVERHEATAALRLSEERFRALSAHAADLVVVLDSMGVMHYVSPSHQAVMGYPPDELHGRRVAEFMHPDDREGVQASYRACVGKAGAIERVELRLRHADGSWRTVDSTMNNCLDDPAVRGVIVTSRDVSARKQAETALRLSEERLRTVVTHAPLILFTLDAQGTYTLSEGQALAKMGLRPGERVGSSVFDAYRGRPEAIGAIRRALGGEPGMVMVRVSDELAFQTQLLPLRDDAGAVSGVLGVAVDVTERVQAEEALRRQALHDALTGLPNRRLLYERLERALLLSRRTGSGVSLLFIDLDGFKAVNDTLGHDAGDLLLQEAARRLRACTRESDTVARLGGDEFTILLPGVTTPNHAAVVAGKILRALNAPWTLHGREVSIRASIGISLSPGDGEGNNAEGMVAAADRAMYRAKRGGKNGYAFATSPDAPISARPLLNSRAG